MDSLHLNRPKPGVIGLMLDGHEKQCDSLNELLPQKGDDPHIEEDSRQDRQRHQLDEGRQKDGTQNDDMCQHGGQSLFLDPKKLWLFTGGGTFRFDFEGIHMHDGEYGSRDIEWKSQEGAEQNEPGDNEEIEVVPVSLFEFVILAIHDYRGNLLIHYNEDCVECRGEEGDPNDPVTFDIHEVNDPSPIQGRAKRGRHLEAGDFESDEMGEEGHYYDGNENTEIGDGIANLKHFREFCGGERELPCC